MSSNPPPLVTLVSLGSINNTTDQFTYALLFLNQPDLVKSKEQWTFTCTPSCNAIGVQTELFSPSQTVAVTSQSFQATVKPILKIEQPLPPVIIKGGSGSSSGSGEVADAESFQVILPIFQDNEPTRVSSPMPPFAEEYIIISYQVYGVCEIFPNELSLLGSSFLLSPGFSVRCDSA
jgi:hypothetical protein